jgi:uncharacterized protein (TIGR02246 family)
MSRAYMVVPLLAIGLTTPVWAQQISEQEATRAAEKVIEVLEKGLQDKDAAGVAALFTEDAIRVVSTGPQVGRAQIEKALTGLFKSYKPEYDKITKVTVIGNDIIASVNSFGGTFATPKGSEPVKGYATFVYVRYGSMWKIRLESVSIRRLRIDR